MRNTKISTMPWGQTRKAFVPSEKQILIFNQLIEITQPYTEQLKVVLHTSLQYELHTRHGYRTRSIHPQSRPGVSFVGVAICRLHVGIYFYPLLINPDLLVAEELQPLRNGKSTFHILELTDELKTDIKELLEAGWEYYEKKGWVKIKIV